ncbi:hypothetical protein [Saccharomonospora viridis]|uniref:Uncharacterized protein n=3 Tax=Saccharomonospora viridis TaxID=1852 RepID=C7MUU4_SACVD|nr:hypothetical protein [Saccharomonospora viridis]ACU95657.1 hypothetical protein Svir_05860 [Saccharomonospora viridis DSM 43017]KHF43869.1 hypothetical protein MINT15_21740 [Saccharomonospora viridis]SFP91864.1 hypothetical protein SAMN02982918_3883 [Saccharomonospora viridis]
MVRASPPRVVVATVVLAWVVTIAAQVAAAVWGSTTPEPVRPEPPRRAHGVDCGDEVCRVFASTMVNGMSVELLANSDGGVGRLRAGGPASGTVTETGLTSKGVRLNHNSLRCATGATPVCLVRGPYDGGMAGEVHVWRGDSWATVDRFFFSDGGVVMLDDVVDTALPEVILAREVCVDKTRRGNRLGSCSNVGVLAEVVDLEGDRAGCTVPRTSPGELPGWPEVQVRRDDLTECPDDLEAG